MVQPAALDRPHLSRTGVVVDRQLDTGSQGGQENPLAALGVQAQRLDVNAGGDKILEQRDLVDVDGQQLTLRQSDQRQWGAAAGGGHDGRDGCGHVFGPFVRVRIVRGMRCTQCMYGYTYAEPYFRMG